MPRKTNTDKSDSRGRRGSMEKRTPRPKPKIDFTVDALDFKNTNLLALSAPAEPCHQARPADAVGEVISTRRRLADGFFVTAKCKRFAFGLSWIGAYQRRVCKFIWITCYSYRASAWEPLP
jgi:hypothetical protein